MISLKGEGRSDLNVAEVLSKTREGRTVEDMRLVKTLVKTGAMKQRGLSTTYLVCGRSKVIKRRR